MIYMVDDRSRRRWVKNSAQVVVGFQQTERVEFHLMVDEIQSGMALDERVGTILEGNESKFFVVMLAKLSTNTDVGKHYRVRTRS